MSKIIVLGSGLVGSVMADDLSKNHDVTSVDVSTKNLEKIKNNKVKKYKLIFFMIYLWLIFFPQLFPLIFSLK